MKDLIYYLCSFLVPLSKEGKDARPILDHLVLIDAEVQAEHKRREATKHTRSAASTFCSPRHTIWAVPHSELPSHHGCEASEQETSDSTALGKENGRKAFSAAPKFSAQCSTTK